MDSQFKMVASKDLEFTSCQDNRATVTDKPFPLKKT